MKSIFSVLLLIAFGTVSVQAAEPLDSLSIDDRAIFDTTYKICQTGTTGSALRLGFDLKSFSESLSNGLKIASGNVDASESRMRSGGLSPRIHQIRNSEGFWLAMTQCYGYRFGELNYGLLMKQFVDMGHLANEVGAVTVTIGSVMTGARYTQGLTAKFPLVSRFIFTTLISLQLNSVFNGLKNLLWADNSEQAQLQHEKIKATIFKDADQAILDIKQAALARLTEIDRRLASENLDSASRTELERKKARIQKALFELENLKT